MSACLPLGKSDSVHQIGSSTSPPHNSPYFNFHVPEGVLVLLGSLVVVWILESGSIIPIPTPLQC